MGTISIDDDVLSELAAVAEARGVTVDEQAASWLRQSLRRHASGRELREMFARISALALPGVPQSDSTVLLREARNH